ncbi:MAG: DUF1330 domain-containing protein [Acidobacteriaceae bacterium]|nr:DUF1330 domain-containing protein [Acidobacteriaceae bacterium]
MAAFVISEVEILDEEIADHYRRLAAASIAEYGGRYLARGAKVQVVEGPPTGRSIVIVEFRSMQRAQEWYGSSSYAEALKLRGKALERRLIFVEGVVPSA